MISDEVYDCLVFDGKKHLRIASFEGELLCSSRRISALRIKLMTTLLSFQIEQGCTTELSLLDLLERLVVRELKGLTFQI